MAPKQNGKNTYFYYFSTGMSAKEQTGNFIQDPNAQAKFGTLY